MAVSSPRSEAQSMRGARGEAHANEWPGAMMPALPELASRPSASFSSRIVTSWPALARKYAVVTPTTPPPSTRVFMASHVEEVTRAHGVIGVEKDLAEAGEICATGDLGQDGRPPLYLRLAADAGGEAQSEQPLAGEGGADAHEAAMMEEGKACAGARSARSGVDLARPPYERVARDAGGVRELVDEDIVHGGLARSRYLDMELGVDGVAYGHSALGDPPGELALNREAEMRRFHDGEHVPYADCDVHRHLAQALDLDGLGGQGHEGRRPAERHLSHSVAVRAHNRLDHARFRVDDDGGLGARAGHEPGLHRHRGGADGAFAAGDVVAARIDEEEAEVRAGRDGLRHDRDEEAAVAARLEAEAGAEIVEVFLEPSPFLGHGRAGQPAEAARHESHADACRVEIYGADHAIGSHSHLRVPRMRLHRPVPCQARVRQGSDHPLSPRWSPIPPVETAGWRRGEGWADGGVGPLRPARSPQGSESGERVTSRRPTPPLDDRPRPTRV